MPSKIHVLFVCLGNICRSPSAEGLFRVRVAEAGLDGLIEADSAGLLAFQVGKAPDPRAQRVAREHAVELGQLRARLVCEEDFERFDYIVAMDHTNLADLSERCPARSLPRLSLLLSHAGTGAPAEVPDPYSGQVSFEHVWALLEVACMGLLQRIQRERGL